MNNIHRGGEEERREVKERIGRNISNFLELGS